MKNLILFGLLLFSTVLIAQDSVATKIVVGGRVFNVVAAGGGSTSAINVSFLPAAELLSANVQAAIEELRAKSLKKTILTPQVEIVEVNTGGTLKFTANGADAMTVLGSDNGVINFPTGIYYDNTISGLTADRMKQAIDEIVANPTGLPEVKTINNGYVLLDADKNKKTLWYNGAIDIDVTIPKNATTAIPVGAIFNFLADSTGSIQFKPEDAAVIMDTVRTTAIDYGSWVSWQKIAANRWASAGSRTEYTLLPPAPLNIYPHQNAINPNNEDATLTGIVEFFNPENVTISVESAITFNGASALKILNSSGLTDTGIFEVNTSAPVDVGTQYWVTVSYYRPAASSGNWNIELSSDDGWVTTFSHNVGGNPTDQWVTVVLSAVADLTTAKLRWRARSGTDNNDFIISDEVIWSTTNPNP